ncbi:hypothetical protein FK004_15600 [Flavobacterium kingsejongi]|uniref:Transmembrane protein n=1 Tax=Flavobacterium kingsejongi TaxID=1678728 RepID=A0A2S1LS08_9FLAO|nr:hypothetical protein FK004_15600 [Flavobacterium kingsejongi]
MSQFKKKQNYFSALDPSQTTIIIKQYLNFIFIYYIYNIFFQMKDYFKSSVTKIYYRFLIHYSDSILYLKNYNT